MTRKPLKSNVLRNIGAYLACVDNERPVSTRSCILCGDFQAENDPSHDRFTFKNQWCDRCLCGNGFVPEGYDDPAIGVVFKLLFDRLLSAGQTEELKRRAAAWTANKGLALKGLYTPDMVPGGNHTSEGGCLWCGTVREQYALGGCCSSICYQKHYAFVNKDKLREKRREREKERRAKAEALKNSKTETFKVQK